MPGGIGFGLFLDEVGKSVTKDNDYLHGRALMDFATEGFAALINLSIGLFALAILTYRLDVRERALRPKAFTPQSDSALSPAVEIAT